MDPAVGGGLPVPLCAWPRAWVVVRAGGLGFDHELAVVYRRVHHDDVLEVEQVGVLRGSDQGPGRVDQLTTRPVTVGEHGEDAAGAQQPRRRQGDLITGSVPAVLGAQAREDQVRPRCRATEPVARGSGPPPSNLLGTRGLPSLAARAVQQCAEILDDPVWLGYAAWWRGHATSHLNRAAHYRRSVAAAENLTSRLDSSDALQACGLLHLSAAWVAGAQAEHDTAATHLAEASALAARMDTEVGTWAHLWFGPTNVGIWKTSIALERREYGQVLEAAKTVYPELLPATVHQAGFWADVGQALVAEKKTRDKGVRVLVCAGQLAPQRIHNDVFVREAVVGLLRQARRDAGGRELRGLAWRMGVAPVG